MKEKLQNIQIQHLPHFSGKDVRVDILRLDLLHPVVSGNKWFKLNCYLADAIAQDKTTIASFGGAYSNHIVAAAFAAKEAGVKSIGYIRGERSTDLSKTLLDAENYGMELVFVDRSSYRDKKSIMQKNNDPNMYWIMEGGYGSLGVKGAAGILNIMDAEPYSHILCAAGTGTMFAGLIVSAKSHQHIIAVNVLKNSNLIEETRALLNGTESKKSFSIMHEYHFGGYAKHPEALITFMKETWEAEQLPTDIVYTSKLLFATKDLVSRKYFPPGSRVLLIHSGGLQGNVSLPLNTLPF